MEKTILASASYYNRNYFYNQDKFSEIPLDIQKELKIALVLAAEKTQGIVSAGFHSNGEFYVESERAADDFDYDEINARLVMNALMEEKDKLFKGLNLWHFMYKTSQGRETRETLLEDLLREGDESHASGC